jgi:peptide/nickel transport system substrate-binding protein
MPGRVEYDVLGTQGQETDPRKARALLKKAGEVGYEITWPYVDDDGYLTAEKDQIARALEQAGFKAAPVAVGANRYTNFRDDPDSPINVRPFGWCSDWPSGGSWFPPLLRTGGSNNYAFFSEQDVDTRIDDILAMPMEKQPMAWGELDEYINEKYYPGPVTGYSSVAIMHGSRVGGMNIDEVSGEPTWKDVFVIGK